jgi:hypothetical protein
MHIDDKLSDHRRIAIGDSHGLAPKPLFFRVRRNREYLYTFVHLGAAAKAVNMTGLDRLYRGGSLQHELTRKRVMPMINKVEGDDHLYRPPDTGKISRAISSMTVSWHGKKVLMRTLPIICVIHSSDFVDDC